MTAKAANSRLSAPPSPVRVAARPPWRWHHCLSVPMWLWHHCRLWRCHWICSVLISYRSARLQQRSAGSHRRLCLWHRGLALCSHRRRGSFRRSHHWYRSSAKHVNTRRLWRNFFDSDGKGGRCIAFPIEQVRDVRLLPHSATALRDASEIAERTGRSVDEFVLGMLRADTVATLTLGQSDGSSVSIDQDSESQAVNTATQDATAASLPFSTLTDNFEQPAIGQLTDSPADTDRNGEVQSDTATALDATAALPSAGSPADNRDIAMAPSVAELTPTHHGVSDSTQLAFSKFEVGKVRDYTTAAWEPMRSGGCKVSTRRELAILQFSASLNQ